MHILVSPLPLLLPLIILLLQIFGWIELSLNMLDAFIPCVYGLYYLSIFVDIFSHQQCTEVDIFKDAMVIFSSSKSRFIEKWDSSWCTQLSMDSMSILPSRFGISNFIWTLKEPTLLEAYLVDVPSEVEGIHMRMSLNWVNILVHYRPSACSVSSIAWIFSASTAIFGWVFWTGGYSEIEGSVCPDCWVCEHVCTCISHLTEQEVFTQKLRKVRMRSLKTIW